MPSTIRMSPKKVQPVVDITTEEKIKNAARTIFHQKGFAATRTRDIAEEAGINLALLNYYYRSKEKLFALIMQESMAGFFEVVRSIMNDEKTSLEKKVELFVGNYIDLLLVEPDIPLFLLSEMRSNPGELMNRFNIRELFQRSAFIMQYQERVASGKIAPLHPLHFMMNVMGLTVFPFIGNPMLKMVSGISQPEFEAMMKERKKLIPEWVKAMLKTR